jgi:hypothetical protein
VGDLHVRWEKTLGTDVRDGGTARQDVFLLRLD